jgi:uncharacterized membrane protein
MREYVAFAVVAGLAWGIGGYFEKAGLRAMGLAPIAGITLRTAVVLAVLGLLSINPWKGLSLRSDGSAWLMTVIGGGVVAGSLGMWSFYRSPATTDNLGVALAVAFAMSPVAGTAIGLLKGDQPMDMENGVGYGVDRGRCRRTAAGPPPRTVNQRSVF